ncbi:hypothetical protein N0M98_33485 [Paenibacillus doosanensis]|uniref:hypothetical protein n=1 Tax=Paenibacillus doosanensis TaxID=1229154 RepID=UPI002180926E|nr:hypothetical protein [Paenibacillus doosanensis]MCS7464998.1 hypothetical protein [Paenibacillus doosanensis]
MADPLWIGNSITAIATVTASAVGFYSAIKINKNSLINDRNKFNDQLLWEKQKIESGLIREHINKKYEIYNQILQVSGEVYVLIHDPIDFHYKNYFDKIRPLLYQNYHLIDDDIRELVRDIDLNYSMEEFAGEMERQYAEKSYASYNKMFELIDGKYLNSTNN